MYFLQSIAADRPFWASNLKSIVITLTDVTIPASRCLLITRLSVLCFRNSQMRCSAINWHVYSFSTLSFSLAPFSPFPSFPPTPFPPPPSPRPLQHAAYLILRGLKTLHLRVERQNATALRLAHTLENHPKASKRASAGVCLTRKGK